MQLLSLGNNFYKLIKEIPSETEKVKIPANRRHVVFTKVGDTIRIIRGNLFISVAEIAKEFNAR